MSDPLRLPDARGGSSHPRDRAHVIPEHRSGPYHQRPAQCSSPKGQVGRLVRPRVPLWRGERDPRESGRSARAWTMPAYAATMPSRPLSADTGAVVKLFTRLDNEAIDVAKGRSEMPAAVARLAQLVRPARLDLVDKVLARVRATSERMSRSAADE